MTLKSPGGTMKRALLLLLVLLPCAAEAECICTCVNGQVRPICRSSLDLPPICAPQVCPIAPPSIQPIPQPSVPPIGTTKCEFKQVLNPVTQQYEWRRICQ